MKNRSFVIAHMHVCILHHSNNSLGKIGTVGAMHVANAYQRSRWSGQPGLRSATASNPMRFLASASFQPVGEEELELKLAPQVKTGFHGVQAVSDDCYQSKIHKTSGPGFVVCLAACGCNSVLLAAWLFARAVKSREDGTLETSSFKTSMKEVRLLCPCP